MAAPHPAPPQTEATPRDLASPSAPIASRFVALLFVGIFLMAVVLPLAKTDFREVQKFSSTENRSLNKFPSWSWNGKALSAFPAQYEDAFNDHFGFRSFFMNWHSRMKLWLGVSPTSNVVLGQQGWLYLSASVKLYRGNTGISKSEVDGWVRELKTKQAWLAARNIRYLLVLVPNKDEVYPEYLPKSFFRVRQQQLFDDVLARLGNNSGVEILDLRQTLCDGKSQGLMYDRTDTHWSQLGAFLASNQILQRLQSWFPDLHPQPLAQRKAFLQTRPGGDLASMVGLPEELTEERLMIPSVVDSFQSVPQRLQIEWPPDSLKDTPAAFESRAKQPGLTLLVTGDSFGKGLMQFLPEHFQRVFRLRPQIPYTPWFQALIPALVEAEKPDIYLDVFCTQSLKHPPKVLVGGK